MAPPDAHLDPNDLKHLLKIYQITTIHFVPSMLAIFIDSLQNNSSSCTSLRQVFCSGEALSVDLSLKWERLTKTKLYNLYGPTEAAIDVTAYPAFGKSLAVVKGTSVPIGFPVWNTGVHIIDSCLKKVPSGAIGELYLTGMQLAKGYLHRPDLTAKSFIANPFGDGDRMYRTGDLVRQLPDRSLEYLGRIDDQVKIRGQRVELGEINHLLVALPGVKQAITHVQRISNDYDSQGLVSYIVADDHVKSTKLHEILKEKLPVHMVPNIITKLDKFPLKSNGKLDFHQLPSPKITASEERAPYPGLETKLAYIFASTLGLEKSDISARDDFFNLGGHSLTAIKLVAKVRKDLKLPVSIGQVMVASTIEKLANLLGKKSLDVVKAGLESALVLCTGTRYTLFCFHPASGFAWQFSGLRRYLSSEWALIGIQSPDINGILSTAKHLDEVCKVHLDTLRKQQPYGPYHLIGYSLGGVLAQRIAVHLEQEGEKVSFLGLLDTWPPEVQNWDKKRRQRSLDPNVLKELNKEKEQFLTDQHQQIGKDLDIMFDIIKTNYANSVRLLATTSSIRFSGNAVLFLATQTQQPGKEAEKAWSPYIENMSIHPLNCTHVGIISVKILKKIGPRLQYLLEQSHLDIDL
jgi:enterobactin synthetase component F